MPSMYGDRDWKEIERRRAAYAIKLRALGVVENSRKWHSLMYRKVH